VVGGKSMIVLTIDDQPTQAWCVIDHTIGDTVVPINISTLEECPSRTNVPDLDPLDPASFRTRTTAPSAPRSLLR
jgi:hypothetical protein